MTLDTPYPRRRRRARVTVLAPAALLAAILAGCGGGSSTPAPVEPKGPIAQPVVINLYPNQSSNGPPRIAVLVSSVGTTPVSMPLLFDTGSAGVTLYAPGLFPASMVTATGFIFPPGETSLSYGGITVTQQQGTRTYGSTHLRAQNGNIGYATLTFGDADGQLTTTVMPVFLYFSVTDVATGQPIEVPPFQRGVFGVAATSGTIVIPGSSAPESGYPACAPSTQGTCYVVSPLKYLDYADSVSAGFALSPAAIESCDITTDGNCAPAPILKVGVTAALKSGFSTMSLPCPPIGYTGPASIAGYPVCQKIIDEATVMVSGATLGTLTGNVVFDTGTPDMQISTPAGSAFPTTVAVGSSVLITTPSGFGYGYVISASGPLATIVNADFSGASIVGIGYFTTHSLFIDYVAGTQGWK